MKLVFLASTLIKLFILFLHFGFTYYIFVVNLYYFAEQTNAITIDGDCYGPCLGNCQTLCSSKGYKDWACGTFRMKTACCCKPPKKQIFEETAQLKN